jgi:hypothetical protein
MAISRSISAWAMPLIKLLNDFTPLVERISIDTAVADVACCIDLFGPASENYQRDLASRAGGAGPSNLSRHRAHKAPREKCLASG